MKRIMLGVALLGGIMFAPAIAGASHDAIEDHCPAHNGNPGKDDSGSDDNDHVVDEGTVICVKAGNENSDGGATGFIIADGETTLQEYLFAAGIKDGSGEQGRNVSYWIDYGPALEAFVCFEGEITTFLDTNQTDLNLQISAFLELHVGAEQVVSADAECEEDVVVTTTTTAPPVVTTTTAPPATDTVPVSPPRTAAPVTVNKPNCTELGLTNFATTDRDYDADGDGIGCEVAAPVPAGQLPRTGSGALGLLIGGLSLIGTGSALRILSKMRRANA